MPIDAALCFAFLDIEVAFEIVVLSLFHDFSKGPQLKWNVAVLGPMDQCAWRAKANMGAGEIDPAGIGCTIEIRRGVELCTNTIGFALEGPSGKIDFVIEARICERYTQETVRSGAVRFP